MKETKKTQLGLLFKPKHVGKGRERVKIKIFVSSNSYMMRNRELIKKSIKIQKIRKQRYGFFSGQNKLEMLRKSENENNRFDHFQPDP